MKSQLNGVLAPEGAQMSSQQLLAVQKKGHDSMGARARGTASGLPPHSTTMTSNARRGERERGPGIEEGEE